MFICSGISRCCNGSFTNILFTSLLTINRAYLAKRLIIFQHSLSCMSEIFIQIGWQPTLHICR